MSANNSEAPRPTINQPAISFGNGSSITVDDGAGLPPSQALPAAGEAGLAEPLQPVAAREAEPPVQAEEPAVAAEAMAESPVWLLRKFNQLRRWLAHERSQLQTYDQMTDVGRLSPALQQPQDEIIILRVEDAVSTGIGKKYPHFVSTPALSLFPLALGFDIGMPPPSTVRDRLSSYITGSEGFFQTLTRALQVIYWRALKIPQDELDISFRERPIARAWLKTVIGLSGIMRISSTVLLQLPLAIVIMPARHAHRIADAVRNRRYEDDDPIRPLHSSVSEIAQRIASDSGPGMVKFKGLLLSWMNLQLLTLFKQAGEVLMLGVVGHGVNITNALAELTLTWRNPRRSAFNLVDNIVRALPEITQLILLANFLAAQSFGYPVTNRLLEGLEEGYDALIERAETHGGEHPEVAVGFSKLLVTLLAYTAATLVMVGNQYWRAGVAKAEEGLKAWFKGRQRNNHRATAEVVSLRPSERRERPVRRERQEERDLGDAKHVRAEQGLSLAAVSTRLNEAVAEGPVAEEAMELAVLGGNEVEQSSAVNSSSTEAVVPSAAASMRSVGLHAVVAANSPAPENTLGRTETASLSVSSA